MVDIWEIRIFARERIPPTMPRVEEKYTISKNMGAKFWVTHGRLRGLTFEHFQKKLSPGRGWHLRDSKFRSWTNLTNNTTPSFQSNPIQLNCNPKDRHLPALHSRTQSNAIQQKYRAFNPMQSTSNAIHVISTQPKQPNLSKQRKCGTRRNSQNAIQFNFLPSGNRSLPIQCNPTNMQVSLQCNPRLMQSNQYPLRLHLFFQRNFEFLNHNSNVKT